MSDLTLTEAKDLINKQNQVLHNILKAATTTGITIKKIAEDRWLTSIDGSLQAIGFNPELALEPAQSVLILKTDEAVSIVQILSERIHHGATARVNELLEGDQLVVDMKGDKKRVFTGGVQGIKENDEVFVYGDVVVTAIHKTGKSSQTVAPTGISWEDIGGLEREKELMKEIIEHPIEFKEIYESYGQKTSKGVLLYGPPGNGKTLLGKALATSISKFYGTNINSFFYVKGPELLSQFVGLAEESIRNLFATTRAFYKEHGFPAVIFLDEAEAILSRRGSGISSDVEKTIVPQFLTEMDGIGENNAIVILATNRPDMIDSAILREGRIDKKIRIDNPDRTTAQAIIELNLKKTKVAEELDQVKEAFVNEVFSEKYPLYQILSEDEKKVMMYLRDITSGATLANIVTSSISNAIRRDTSLALKVATGVKCEDAVHAVSNLYEQHKGYKHKEQIEHFAEVNGIKIKNVLKVK